MKKPKKSEKLLLSEIFYHSKCLNKAQKGIEIGQLLILIRAQLLISQRLLAKKADVPQSTISRIESGETSPNLQTLQKLFNALSCNLLITAFPNDDLEKIRQKQARSKAVQKIQYLQGTMALEKQKPDKAMLEELINEEEKRLLDSTTSELWE